MKLLQKHLHEAKESRRLVDIWRDRHDDDAEFCRIEQLSEDFVLATLINDHGEYDGIAIFDITHITRLRWDGIERAARTQLAAPKDPLPTAPVLDLTSWYGVLESVQEHYGHVTIHTQDMTRGTCYIGEMVEQDDEYILLHEYGSMHRLDRSYLVLEGIEVTLVEADGKYERDLMFLHKSPPA
jgi:hypothetical protein